MRKHFAYVCPRCWRSVFFAEKHECEEICPDCEGDGALDDGRDCAWCGTTGFVFRRSA